MTTKASLQTLPPELRHQIYALLIPHRASLSNYTILKILWDARGLIRTNRFFRDDAISYYFGTKSFIFQLASPYEFLARGEAAFFVSPFQLARVERLVLDITLLYNGGSRFERKPFAPRVQDMQAQIKAFVGYLERAKGEGGGQLLELLVFRTQCRGFEREVLVEEVIQAEIGKYVPMFDCIRDRLGSFGCEHGVGQKESLPPPGLVRWPWQHCSYRFRMSRNPTEL